MKCVVIDTNVLHVANQQSPQAGMACVLACVARLERVRDKERTVLDELGLILQEYIDQRFNFSGQPGVGDAFFQFLHQNQANPEVCIRVAIHPRNCGSTDFEEFPTDSALEDFDPSDRKFVAVALACDQHPQILNAVDSDWWKHKTPLENHGLQVEFICPGQFEE